MNVSLTIRNWLVGFYIVEFEQKGEDRAEYGSKLLSKLTESSKHIKGFDERSFRNFRLFYKQYPHIQAYILSYFPNLSIWGSPTTELDLSTQKEGIAIRGSLTTESEIATILMPPEKLLSNLSYTHLEQLFTIEDPLKRSFYEIECIKGTWSVRELKRQINSLYFERSGKQYPEYKGAFLKVIDYQEEYKYDLLNHFKVKDKMPQIAVSVDMLDTGIDVPEVCNLVFFKPVRSSAKFWQMIGRGTRLCKDLFGFDEDKREFVIFDFCENFEFFNNKPKGFEGATSKSLSHRLFELRLRLSFVLQNSEQQELKAYGDEILKGLIAQTQGLNTDSFVVRQHWKQVEKYKDPNAWNALNDLDIKELFDHIAPLMSESDQDEMAKRFDVLMLDIQLSIMQDEKRQVNLIQKVITTAGKLSKKASIPSIASRMDSIKEAQNNTFWQAGDILGIERLRIELRDLIKYLDFEERPFYYTSFTDVFEPNVKEHILVYGFNDLDAYKRKVEAYVRQNRDHITIHKLRNNIQITQDELVQLENMLFEQGDLGTREAFNKIIGEQPLGTFIRSIVGLDANAAKEAFGKILVDQTLNSQQIRFMDMIINFFNVKGVIDPEMLFEPPFTDINTSGIMGVFDEATSSKIIELIQKINHTAEAS